MLRFFGIGNVEQMKTADKHGTLAIQLSGNHLNEARDMLFLSELYQPPRNWNRSAQLAATG